MRFGSVKYFLGFLKKYISQECILIVLMLLASVGTLVSPYILKIIIDEVFPSGDMSLLVQILAIYLGICIARLAINYASTYMFEWVSNHLMKDLRVSVFTHLIRLPLSFFDNQKSGDIIHRVNSEVNSIQNILTGSIVRVINSVCTILGLAVMLSILNLKLFLISLLVFPFIFVNTRYFQPKIQANIKQGRLKDSDILSYLMERFRNIKILKSYMSYDREEAKLSGLIDEQIGLNLRNVRLSATTRNLSLLLTLSIPILILYLGGRDVMAGAMTVGALVAFIQYINRLFNPMRDLMGLYFDMIRAKVSMDRIYEVISIPLETEQNHIETSIPEEEGDIEFQDVHFSYDSAKVLENINIRLERGKKYALIGESGCGKSTIINLLCRFYEPDSGTIKFAGEDVSALDLHEWRQRMSLVTQDNHLFHDTIESNIRYGNEDAGEEEIEQACSLCHIGEHIDEMEERYDSIIGDQGVTLSGGQRQRIALARSILKTGNIILLDEATSAIDAKTENEIIRNIFKIHDGKTIIMVTHRLNAIRGVDEIICIDRGRIVETGTHEQLIEKRGYYWGLYSKQIR